MKERKVPLRRCAGCMESKDKKELLRICLTPEGEVKPDLTGRANGRGIYLCRSKECLEMAKKKRAIGRGLKTELSKEQTEALFAELEALFSQADEA
ncbi:MAG: YlxR family protein [Clostridiales bacterium]|nr:YlxR family protein [Clostridiales bacterium]MBQ3107250.1 YlxR family protein [Bacillota bacterium]